MKNNTKLTTYRKNVQAAFPVGHNEAEGLFGPGSMHWMLYREPGVIIASYRALMLQVAHPAVADGVRQFSVFKTDYLGRAERTFTNMINIYFGDRQTALRAGLGLYTMHGRIRGTITWEDGGRNQTRTYSANDPDLLLWVLATMVEATIYAYEKICRVLTHTEKNQYYEESKRVATLMGIPLDLYPKDLDAFYVYFQKMIDGQVLRVDEITLDLAKSIFKPPFFPAYLAKTLAAGGLPPRWRNAYLLDYSKTMQKTFKGIILITIFLRKMTPHPLGYAPPWYQAHYRIARANGRRPRLIDSFFSWVVKLPFFRGVTLNS